MLTDSFWMENWLVQCSLCCLSHSHKKGCNEVVPPHLADYRGSRSIINPFVEPPMKVTTTQIVNQIQHMKLYYNTLLKSVWASYLPSRHVIVFQPSSSTNPSGLPALGLGWLSATLVWGNSALTSRLYSLNIFSYMTQPKLQHILFLIDKISWECLYVSSICLFLCTGCQAIVTSLDHNSIYSWAHQIQFSMCSAFL